MKVKIEFISGPLTGRRFIIPIGRAVPVGRGAATGIMVSDDRALSREHFVLEFDGVTCHIRDLGSRNGTYLNGARVSRNTLQDGDHIRAGSTQFAINIARETSEIGTILRQTMVVPDAAAAVSVSPRQFEATQTVQTSESIFRPYQAGLHDDDPAVRREALWAAAWSRQPWLLNHCRLAADLPNEENLDAINLLAILGQESDVRRILIVGQTTELGAERFRVVGAFGHPDAIPVTIQGMRQNDTTGAVAASAAFTKITGMDVESETTSTSADEDDAEYALPDAAAAEHHWKQHESTYRTGTRWCQGINLSHEASSEIVNQLDTESRIEAYLRARFAGEWRGNPADLARFDITGKWLD